MFNVNASGKRGTYPAPTPSAETERSQRRRIANVMRGLIADDTDETYLDNSTGLAEDAAHEMGHDEWLDDPHHPVWEVANEVAEEHNLLT